jgi:hypothetical protein
MKKTLLIAAAALVAGVISSEAQVYSANIVGYVNQSYPTNAVFLFVENPLLNTTNDLYTLFPTLPTNTKIWEFVSGVWVPYTKRASGTISGYDGHEIKPGEGFFYQSPVGSTVVASNTFVGNVIQGTNITPYLVGGFTSAGNYAPVAGGVQTVLGVPAVSGDKIWTFDPATGWLPATRRTSTWSGSSYSGTPGSPASGEPVIAVGQGFLINGVGAGTSGSWTNVWVSTAP